MKLIRRIVVSVLAVCIILSASAFSTLAASDSSIETRVSYDERASYIVTIPGAIAFNQEGKASADITASDVKLEVGKSINVSVHSTYSNDAGKFYMKDGDSEVGYSINVKDQEVYNGDVVAYFQQSDYVTMNMQMDEFWMAGSYEAPLTFNISYEDDVKGPKDYRYQVRFLRNYNNSEFAVQTYITEEGESSGVFEIELPEAPVSVAHDFIGYMYNGEMLPVETGIVELELSSDIIIYAVYESKLEYPHEIRILEESEGYITHVAGQKVEDTKYIAVDHDTRIIISAPEWISDSETGERLDFSYWKSESGIAYGTSTVTIPVRYSQELEAVYGAEITDVSVKVDNAEGENFWVVTVTRAIPKDVEVKDFGVVMARLSEDNPLKGLSLDEWLTKENPKKLVSLTQRGIVREVNAPVHSYYFYLDLNGDYSGATAYVRSYVTYEKDGEIYTEYGNCLTFDHK